MAYENYKKRYEGKNVDNAVWRCPKCNMRLDFGPPPEETYMMDGTFIRDEELYCGACDIRVYITQVYEPKKMTVEVEEV